MGARTFIFGEPAKCSTAFTHAGVDYKVGESFPYATLSLSEFDLYGLWLAQLVDFEHRPPPPPTSPKHQPQRR